MVYLPTFTNVGTANTIHGWYGIFRHQKAHRENHRNPPVKEGSSQWLGQSPWKRTWHAGHRHRRPRFCWRFVSRNFFWGWFFWVFDHVFVLGLVFPSSIEVLLMFVVYAIYTVGFWWYVFFWIHRGPRLYKGIDQRLPTYSDWLRILREIFLRQSSHVTCNIL